MPVMSCSENGSPGWKYGASGKCYTYTAGNEKASGKAKQKAYLQGATITGGKMTEDEIKEMEELEILEAVSDAPWSSVDKSKLPKSAFLWVEDPKKKSTWHLPYKDAQGNINLGALRAISAAVAGARTGTPMSIPADVRKKIDGLLKKYKIGEYAKASANQYDDQLVHEFELEINTINFVREAIGLEKRGFYF